MAAIFGYPKVTRKLLASDKLHDWHPGTFVARADRSVAAVDFYPSHCVLEGYTTNTAIFYLFWYTIDVDCAVQENLAHLAHTIWTQIE